MNGHTKEASFADQLRAAIAGSRWRRIAGRQPFQFESLLVAVVLGGLMLLPVGAWAEGSLDVAGLAASLVLLVGFGYALVYVPRRGLYASNRGVAVVNAFSFRRYRWCEVHRFELQRRRSLGTGGVPLESLTVVTDSGSHVVGALSRPTDYRTRRLSPALARRRSEFGSYEAIAAALQEVRDHLCSRS